MTFSSAVMRKKICRFWNVRESPRRASASGTSRVTSSSGEAHSALLRQVEAGDQVEQRGLAGAVRSDDREDLALLDRQAHIVDGMHAAERDRQVLGGQDGHPRLAVNAPAKVGTMPARRKIITPMMMRPSTICS